MNWLFLTDPATFKPASLPQVAALSIAVQPWPVQPHRHRGPHTCSPHVLTTRAPDTCSCIADRAHVVHPCMCMRVSMCVPVHSM